MTSDFGSLLLLAVAIWLAAAFLSKYARRSPARSTRRVSGRGVPRLSRSALTTWDRMASLQGSLRWTEEVERHITKGNG